MKTSWEMRPIDPDAPDPQVDWLQHVGLGNGSIVQADGASDRSFKGVQESTALDGGEVLIAVIDDGIAFAHDRFRLGPTETRVEYFWSMESVPAGAGPSPVPAGRTLRKSEIDALLAQYDGEEEERIYRACGLIDPRRDARQPLRHWWSHGTHVLDVAAGYDWRNTEQRKAAKKRPIVAVQLPPDVVADTTGSLTAPYLQAALDRIFDNAVDLARRIEKSSGSGKVKYLPLVVNFSFGVFAGPLDGESPVEAMIDAFAERYRALDGGPLCEVVLPAGNSFQERAVARFEAGPVGDVHEIPLRVQPCDKTVSFVHVWLPAMPTKSNGSKMSVSLVPPRSGPDREEWSICGQMLDWEVDGQVLARIYHRHVLRSGGKRREQAVIAIRPTEVDNCSEPRAPAGLWTIRLRNDGLDPTAAIDLRVQRDDPLIGQDLRARQSYFDQPDYVRFDCPSGRERNHTDDENGPVTRRGSLNAYAGSRGPVVVGGFRRSDGAPARYSAAGRPGESRDTPDLSAVTEESEAHYGVIGAGTFSGSVYLQNGTSVAVPAFVRAFVDALLDKGGTTRDAFIASVAGAEGGHAGPRGKYVAHQPERHGHGRLVPDDGAIPGHRRRVES